MVEVRAENEFKQWHSLHDLKKTDLGKEFVSKGERYALVGLNSKSRKYPIIVKKVKTGEIVGFGLDYIKLALAHPEDENARSAGYKQQQIKEAEGNFLTFFLSLGLQKTDLGREFTWNGQTYKIIGATEHKRKRGESFNYGHMDILATHGENTYVFTKDDVAKCLKQATAA